MKQPHSVQTEDGAKQSIHVGKKQILTIMYFDRACRMLSSSLEKPGVRILTSIAGIEEASSTLCALD